MFFYTPQILLTLCKMSDFGVFYWSVFSRITDPYFPVFGLFGRICIFPYWKYTKKKRTTKKIPFGHISGSAEYWQTSKWNFSRDTRETAITRLCLFSECKKIVFDLQGGWILWIYRSIFWITWNNILNNMLALNVNFGRVTTVIRHTAISSLISKTLTVTFFFFFFWLKNIPCKYVDPSRHHVTFRCKHGQHNTWSKDFKLHISGFTFTFVLWFMLCKLNM